MEMLSNTSVDVMSGSAVIKDYDEDFKGEPGDRMSMKIDLSMAEQFYYEVISSFEQEEVVQN